MTEAFNPYREWLGLEGDLQTPSYYQLAGVDPLTEDRALLVAAIDKAVVRVRGFRPGRQAAAWARLLDELAEAKACFQDPARRAAYDAQLRRATHASAAPDSPADASAPHDAPALAVVNRTPDLYPPGMTPKSAPAQAPARAPVPAPAPTPAPAEPTGPVPVPALTRNAYPPGMGSVPASAPHSAAKPNTQPAAPKSRAVPPAEVGTRRESHQPAPHSSTYDADRAAVSTPEPPGPVNAHVAPPRKPRKSLVPAVAAISGILIVATLIIFFLALGNSDQTSGSRSTSPAQPVTGVPASPEVPAPPASAPPQQTANPSPAPAQLQPFSFQPQAGNPDPVTRNLQPQTPSPAPPAPDPQPQVPGPLPPVPNARPPGPNPQPQASGLSPELSRLLLQAQAALAERQFRVADRMLEQAVGLATNPVEQATVARLRQLGTSAEAFWQVVATAIPRLRAAQELTIGASADRLVIVVEAGPDSLTIRDQGRNTRYELATMPPGLALAIARSAVDVNDSQSLVLFGACAATVKDRQPVHVDEARRYWEQAQSRGADVDDLLGSLRDTYQP